MRSALRSSLRRLGYEIRKTPAPGYRVVSVFDLAVQFLMRGAGSALRFIQIGANDGQFADPLRKYIAAFSWSGVFVEPQPDVFERLRRNYPPTEHLHFENVAISRQPTLTLYRAPAGAVRDQVHASAVASFRRRITSRQVPELRARDLEELTVPCLTLDALVAKYDLGEFDVLQIDTEGYDWQVLQTLDLSRTRPSLIQFEHGHLTPRDIQEAAAHLHAHGYAVHFGGHESDSVALRDDVLPI